MIAFFWNIFRFWNERNAIPFILLPIAEWTWNGLSKVLELFTVDASSLALTSMDSFLPSVVLITEDSLSSYPPKKLHLRGQNKANSFFDKPLYASELSATSCKAKQSVAQIILRRLPLKGF